MFSSSSVKNRRRRAKRPRRPAKTSFDQAPAAADPRARVHTLHAQIGELETYLERRHQVEVTRRRMKKENILPPPEPPQHRPSRAEAASLGERRRRLKERNRNGLRFLMLFCIACAIGWWIIFAGV